MEMKVKTTLMQNLMVKASKCASNNKLRPITGLMGISVADGELRIMTTDDDNYLMVKSKLDGVDEFDVVVSTDIIKLIQRITSEYVVFAVDNNVLTITGNGKYKIALEIDDSGNSLRYPFPMPDVSEMDKIVVKTDNLNLVKNVCSSSIGIKSDTSCYDGYYVGDRVIATNGEKLASVDIDLFAGKVTLISPEMMKLLDVVTSETVDVYYSEENKMIVFETDNCIIFGPELYGIEEYDVDAISDLIELDYGYECEIPKTELLSLLDRVNIFVDVYDNNIVRMKFDKSKLTVQSLKSSAVEEIAYMAEQADDYDYECQVNVQMLTELVKANTSESIRMHYGNEKTLKITDDNVVQILALCV